MFAAQNAGMSRLLLAATLILCGSSAAFARDDCSLSGALREASRDSSKTAVYSAMLDWSSDCGSSSGFAMPRNDKEAQARDKAWVAYCKPTVKTDPDGIRRNAYAHDGCEYGQTKP